MTNKHNLNCHFHAPDLASFPYLIWESFTKHNAPDILSGAFFLT